MIEKWQILWCEFVPCDGVEVDTIFLAGLLVSIAEPSCVPAEKEGLLLHAQRAGQLPYPRENLANVRDLPFDEFFPG